MPLNSLKVQPIILFIAIFWGYNLSLCKRSCYYAARPFHWQHNLNDLTSASSAIISMNLRADREADLVTRHQCGWKESLHTSHLARLPAEGFLPDFCFNITEIKVILGLGIQVNESLYCFEVRLTLVLRGLFYSFQANSIFLLLLAIHPILQLTEINAIKLLKSKCSCVCVCASGISSSSSLCVPTHDCWTNCLSTRPCFI